MRWLLAFLLIAAAPARGDLGEMVPCPGVLGAEVKAIPEAGVAVLYDRCDRRHRLLTADGRVSDLPSYPGKVMFDDFRWIAATRVLYLYAGFARFDPAARRFVPIPVPGGARAKAYVPRWNAIVTAASGGLFRTTPAGMLPLPTRAMPGGYIDQLRDLPRFGALLIEMNGGALFMRTTDGQVHALGRYAHGHETVQSLAELRGSDAVQLLTARDGFHIAMRRGADGIWRPGRVTQVALDTGTQAWVNGYVPALDAMFVRVPGWRLADWWFGRSGFYTLGPEGLRPYGRYTDRPGERDIPDAMTLSDGQTFLSVRQGLGGPEPRYRVTRAGFVAAPLPAGVGPFASAREVPGTGQVVVTTSDALFRLDGARATLLSRGNWPMPWPLPLTREVAFWEASGLGIVAVDGSRRHVHYTGEKARVIQLAPDRLFVIGDRITSLRVPRKR